MFGRSDKRFKKMIEDEINRNEKRRLHYGYDSIISS